MNVFHEKKSISIFINTSKKNVIVQGHFTMPQNSEAFVLTLEQKSLIQERHPYINQCYGLNAIKSPGCH